MHRDETDTDVRSIKKEAGRASAKALAQKHC